ncbi:MAG: hypothetical protein M0R70_14725 [Nitrospirae bacterium]|nr:hypothetical protein [Nitrospirota bacterium]
MKKKIIKKKTTTKSTPDDNDDFKIDVFIPYPPDAFIYDKDNFPSWMLSETDIIQQNSEELIALKCKRSGFVKNGNPVLAIEAFLLARDLKVYPPMWVIDFFANAFEKYHDKLGLIDLDSVLGLKGVGKKGGAFKPLLDDQRDEMLMRDVYWLTRLGYSPDQAASIVARFLESIPDAVFNKTWIGINKISDTTIKDKWNKKWHTHFEDADKIEDVKIIHDQWIRDNKSKFMQKFCNVLSEEELKILPRRKR